MNAIASSSNSPTRVGSDQVLRSGIRLDAAVSGAFGLVLLASGGLLSGPLGMPAPFLWAVAGVCVVYAAALLLVQSRPAVSAATGWTFVIANCVWVVASILLLIFQWLPLTTLGIGFVSLQAIVVGGLAYLQWLGARQANS